MKDFFSSKICRRHCSLREEESWAPDQQGRICYWRQRPTILVASWRLKTSLFPHSFSNPNIRLRLRIKIGEMCSNLDECINLDMVGKEGWQTPLILSIWWPLVIWKSAWDFDISKFTVCWPSLASISAHLLIVCHYLSSSVLLAVCSLLTGSVSWPTPSVWTSHRRHPQTDSLHTQCSRDIQHRNTNIKHTLKKLNLNILLTPLSDR